MKKTSQIKPRLLALLFLFALSALYLLAVITPLFFSNAKHRDSLAEASASSATHASLRARLTQTKNALSETAAMTDAGMHRLSANVPLHKTQKRLYELAVSSGLRLEKLKYETPLPRIDPDESGETDALIHLGTQLSLTGKWRDYLVFRERIANEFHKIQIHEERIETRPGKSEPEMHLNFTMFRRKSVLQ